MCRYGAVVRGDANSVTIGAGSNVQDNTTIKTTAAFPTVIGEQVTIGHNVVMNGCTIGDKCLIGMGSVIGEGATIESGAFLAAGSVVPPGTTVPGKQVWGGNPVDLSKPLKVKMNRGRKEGRKMNAQHFCRINIEGRERLSPA